MTDFVKALKEQINIADVVGEYVRLRKTGTNHMGLCPFHAERSPSFSVSEKKGIYHCFGCQKGGDVISFVQEIQGVSFHEAIRLLASKFGIKVPAEFAARAGSGRSTAPGAEERAEVLYKLNRFVAQFYHENLLGPSGAKAREYLTRRGLSEATIRQAYIGYAPAEWAALHDFLEEKKAPLDKAEELGLIRRKSTGADMSGRSHYDLFRDRIIFPVTDHKGRVIAFGGRALGDSDGPKYLNSTESPIYNKGSHLYGMFFAQKDIRAEDACVLVEGFMDCISLHQAGIGFAVATLGTALTEKQVASLKRFTRNITVLFDGDAAGKEAQLRAMEIFLNEDVVVRGVSLPDGLDPDEFVLERGADALKKLLMEAPFVLDQQILEQASQAGVHTEARARAADKILPWVAKISSDTARMVRLQELTVLFGIPFEILERKVQGLMASVGPKPKSQSAVPQAPGSARSLSAGPSAVPTRPGASGARPVVRSNSMGGPVTSGRVDVLDLRFVESLIRNPQLVYAITDKSGILDGLETEAARHFASTLFSALESRKDTAIGSEAVDWAETAELKSAVRRALLETQPEQEEERQLKLLEAKDLEKKLLRRGLERRKESLRADLLKAEGSGQSDEVSRLMSQYKELVQRLDESLVVAERERGEF